MQIAPGLLATLVPIAKDLVQQLGNAAQPLGQSFGELLNSTKSQSLSPSVGASPIDSGRQSAREKYETLPDFARRLTAWLRGIGITGDLDVSLGVNHLDNIEVDTFGENAEAVESLLASNPDWLNDLRRAVGNSRIAANTIGGSAIQSSANPAIKSRLSSVTVDLNGDTFDIRWDGESFNPQP